MADDDSSVSSEETAFGVGPDFGSDYIDAVHEGIIAAAQKWNLTLSLREGKQFGDFEYEGPNTKRLGNLCIAVTTKTNYEEQLKQLWRFCAIKGDYESMLLMITPTPPYAPSMRVETVEEFLRFKRQAKNMPLTTFDGSGTIKDIRGEIITTEGHWKAPRQAGIYSAAVSAIHCQNRKGGEYADACDGCRDGTCNIQAHSAAPKLLRSGNPTTDCIFKNSMRQRKKDSVGYQEEGASQLLPSDLRDLRTTLLNSQSIVDLQTWTIIIVSVCLFLRHDKFHSIKVEQFDPSLFCIKEDQLAWLALRIMGKCDKLWYTFRLCADDKHPDLCPVRAIAVYSYLIGIKGGCLFPSERELLNPPEDGIYKTTIVYTTLMAQLKRLCDNHLQPRKGGVKIGCHTFRKTGYLVAVFGDANDMNLMVSARHKSQTEAKTYKRDASALLAIHRELPNPKNDVSKWQSILMQSVGTAGLMTASGGSLPMDFVQIGEYFVKDLLHVMAEHPTAKSPSYLMLRSLDYVKTEDPEQSFQAYCCRIHPAEAVNLKQVVNSTVAHCIKTINRSEADAKLPPALSQAEQGISGSRVGHAQEGPAQKKAKSDNNNDTSVDNLDERKTLKHLTTAKEKIICMVRIMERVENSQAEAKKTKRPFKMTSGAKSFVSRSLKPAINCVKTHFGGNTDAFCEKYPSFNHTTFSANHCCV